MPGPSLLNETVDVKIYYQVFYEKAPGVYENVNAIVYQGNLTVGSGVELNNQAFSYTFNDIYGPHTISGNLTVDLTGDGYTATFSGTSQPSALQFVFSSLNDESISKVTGATETSQNLGPIAYGQDAYVDLNAANSVVTSTLFLAGYQPGAYLSHTVALTYAAGVTNTPPTVSTNTGSIVLEGGVDTITNSELRATDSQQAASALTYTLTSLATNGSLRLNGTAIALNGTFTQADIDASRLTYAHNGSETTSAAFGFSVSDGAGGSVTGRTFNFTVTPVNDAPSGANKTITTAEDTGVALVAADFGFSDVDGNALSAVVITTLPNAGSLTLNGVALTAGQSVTAAQLAANQLVYTPAANANGAGYASFTFQVRDTGGTANGGADLDASPNTITFNVSAVNDAPILTTPLVDRSFAEDGVVSFTLPGNAFTDVDGDALTYSAALSSGAALPAWLSFDAASRTFTGTPPTNYNGTIAITVTASDGSLARSDEFDLVITSVNDAPVVANALADRGFAEDSAVSFTLPANAFSDVDGDTLTYSATLASGAALPAWLSFDAATRSFTGTPPANYNGSIAVKVTASDGSLAASDTFDLVITAVNDAPILATPLADQSFAEDSAVSFTLPGNAFSDVDGDTLTYSATLASGAALPTWLTFNAATRTFAGTPPADYNGSLAIKVTASDGSLSASDEFNLVITPVNDAPIVATALADQSFAEDSSVSFTLPANAFSDVDGDSLSYAATLANGAALPSWLTFNAATRSFEGTPPADYNGTLSVRVTASDGSLSTSDAFDLVITPVNDAPIVATPLADQSFAEDSAVSFTLPANAFSDVDGDTLSYSATLASGAALPAWLTFDATTRSFNGTPPADYNGSLAVTVTASDGSLSATDAFNLVISPVNDAPVVATPLANQSFAEDNAVSFTLPGNAFTDVDGDALTYSAALSSGAALPAWLSFDAASRTFTGTPPTNYNGTIAITVTASDGSLARSDEFDLVITPVNDAPVVANALADRSFAEDSAVSFTLPANAFSDVDGDTLTYSATLASGAALPAWLSFDAATRSFTGTPPANYNGSIAVKVTASDGSLAASDTFDLVITAVNDAPILATPLADQSFAEDSAVSFTLPGNAFSDVDGDTLTYSAALSSGAALPAWLSFDAASRTFTGTPPADYNGTIAITVTASDGSLSASDGFDLVITPVDDPATARNDSFVVSEGGKVTGSIYADNGFGADTDPDGPIDRVVAVDQRGEKVGEVITLPSGGTFVLRGNGNFSFDTAGAYSALGGPQSGASNAVQFETFTYTLAGGNTATVTVQIIGIDNADYLRGTAGDDTLFAGIMDDVLMGGLGADVLDGGTGADTASYADNFGAIFVNLTTGRGYGNAAQGDTYISIENIVGSSANDFIIGDAGDNRLDGAGGNDILIGGLGADALVGGAGNDTASYEDNQGAVFVNLSTGRGFNNAAQGDTYEGIENLLGGLFDDFFIGNDGANRLTGAMGADTLIGAGGADTFVFDYVPGAVSGFGGANVDTIVDFVSGEDRLELSASVFTAIGSGTLSAGAFVAGTAAQDADDRIIYDQSTGQIFYDADGSGGTAAVLFAVLENRAAIVATDFVIA